MSGRAINWYLQRITGAALLVLLIMHFWVEHFTAEVRTPAGLTFEVIQRRFFQNPWFVAIDITFLFIALYHGLNGIRNICLDYTWGTRFRTPDHHRPRARRHRRRLVGRRCLRRKPAPVTPARLRCSLHNPPAPAA